MHSQRSSKIAVPVSVARDYSFLRQALLLATALFLIAAPALNAQDIAEITAGFLAPDADQLGGIRVHREPTFDRRLLRFRHLLLLHSLGRHSRQEGEQCSANDPTSGLAVRPPPAHFRSA